MNNFQGNISDIQSNGLMSIVRVKLAAGQIISAVVIDTPNMSSYLQLNHSIQVLFKETEVIVSLEESPMISIQNKIRGLILHIEYGQLLSRLVIDTAVGQMVAVISTKAVKDLSLKENLPITALININEVILAP